MSEKKTDEETGELTHEQSPIKWVLHLNDVSDDGMIGEKNADADELRLLTELLNDEHNLNVNSFRCTYEIKPQKMATQKNIEGYRGYFTLKAELRQTCVVTLEPIDTVVIEEFFQDFTSGGGASSRVAAQADELDDPFAEEPPMRLLKGRAQIGPLAYQYLSMAIDVNPRKQGVNFEGEADSSPEAGDRPPSPFVVLEKYKHNK